MIWLILGTVVLLVVLLGMRKVSHADPKALTQSLRVSGIVLLVALSVLAAVTGRLALLGPLVLFTAALARYRPGGGGPFRFGGWAGAKRSANTSSEVTTVYLKMTLYHDTGQMDGKVTAGQFKGRRLSGMNREEFAALLEECRENDPEAMRLLEAYLERHAEGGGGGRVRSDAMSREEAYEVLDLAPGASSDDIKAAHKKLQLKLHPDQGGSNYLAAKINQAKDVLLGKA